LHKPERPANQPGHRGEFILSLPKGIPFLGDVILENKKRIFGFGRCSFLFLPENKSLWDQPQSALFHFKNLNQLDKIKKKSHIMYDF